MTTTVPARPARGLVPAASRDIFQTLRDEMEDLFGRFFTDGGADGGQVMRPSLDLSETDAAVQVRMDVPGMKAEDIDIEISGNSLRGAPLRQLLPDRDAPLRRQGRPGEGRVCRRRPDSLDSEGGGGQDAAYQG
jgi:HSP20 family molecular chaperone IbpA